MEDTVFHKIVRGEIPCYKIYENENYLAFLDKFPLAYGHTLVIPKKFYKYVWDVPDDEIGEYFQVCRKIAIHFRKVTEKEIAYCLILGTGVPYAHIHIIPSSLQIRTRLHSFFEATQAPELLENEAKGVLEKFSIL